MNRFGMERSATIDRAITLGVVAGMRSQVPLALMSVAARQGRFARESGLPLRWLKSDRVAFGLGVSALGEAFFDKLPFVPSRLKPAPFLGRMLFGGLAGAAIAMDEGQNWSAGLVPGAAGAAAGTLVGYTTRRALDAATGWPDVIWALVEDVAAIVIGSRALGLGNVVE